MTAETNAAFAADPSRARRERWRGHAAMTLFACIISGSFSLGGLSAALVDPKALTALRFLIAASVLAGLVIGGAWIRVRRRGALLQTLRPLGRNSWRFLLLGALYGGYFVCMFEALRRTGPTPLAAVFTLTPLMTAGLAYWVAGQKTRRPVLFALLLGAAGALWVVFDGDWEKLRGLEIGTGETIFFVGAIGHALYAALLRKLKGPEPLGVFALGVLLGALLVVAIAGVGAILETDWSALAPIVWITAVYLALFATVATTLILQFAALRLPASKVMAYTYLPPSLVMLIEGASGRGWAPAAILPGVAMTLAALVLLARDEG